jgi:proline dehydrogenase
MLDAPLRAFFLWLAHRRWLARLVLRTPLARRMPLRFVAGTTLDQAVETVRGLNAAGMQATLDHLGESVTDQATAEQAAAAYLEAIERIASEGLDANVSIKLTQMGMDLGVDVCRAVLRPVLEAGKRHGIFVRIDMESSDYVDRTLEVVRGMRAEGYDTGPVIQSYLHRSKADVAALAAEGARVRVCKGAYAESVAIAWHDRATIGQSFVELCETLLSAGTYPGVATHDPAMIEAVSRFASQHRVTPDRFEFQMLHGIRRDLQRALVADGWRMRVYVPYGTEWWPYFMRRLAERPANVMFVLRGLLGEGRGEPPAAPSPEGR